MWGLACTNMFPSTQKDRANVLESRPRRSPPNPPLHPHLSLAPSRPALRLLFVLLPHLGASLSVATSLLSGALFLVCALLPPAPPPSLRGCSHFSSPEARSSSGGMYGFIWTMPTFYWIPIARQQSERIPNSSRANLIQNS